MAAFAADPAEVTPDSAAKEKVSDTQKTGGALKVQKTPAEVEGMNAPKAKHHGHGKKHSKKHHKSSK